MQFSPEIKNFLKQVGKSDAAYLSEVPKSLSCGIPGDFMLFRYRPKYRGSIVQSRVLLLTRPVVKDAKTGNLLLTGFDVELPGDYGPLDLIALYTDKKLPENSYRTFILSRMVGPLYRLRP